MPGQTRRAVEAVERPFEPSMEGRTIARPDMPAGSHVADSSHPSMEGRTIARPDKIEHRRIVTEGIHLQWRAGQLPGQTCGRPSLCGSTFHLQWRAGQLPGQTTRVADTAMPKSSLQWRAGQLPGQT